MNTLNSVPYTHGNIDAATRLMNEKPTLVTEIINNSYNL